MAHTQTSDAYEPSDFLLDQLMVEMGLGFNAYLERRAAMQQLKQLQQLSDTELAKRGLRRDTILDHVVRHLGAGTCAAA